ncbi:sugar efflux transporter for intercellular exchange domain-containing protein [Phthorimaea operculella]|nr:sugar efflux transporter for intercellular exchange domain-containing protein [Phthorimaea operculella]
MFSGSFMCYDIYKQGSTKGVGIMPFVGGFIMSVINLKYGYILRDHTIVQVNFVGLALNLIYLMIYFQYATEKFKVWLQMGAGIAFSAAMIAYAQYEDPKLVESRFGTMITAFMFYLIASPLFGLNDIIKNKSTEGLPFPIIFSGTIVTFMWLLYGIILKNNFLIQWTVAAAVVDLIKNKSTEGLPFPIIFSGTIVTFMWLLYGIILKNNFLIVQNVVALFLCSVQLSLFVIYPSKPKKEKTKAKAKKAD